MAPSLAAPGGGLQGFLLQLHDTLRSSDPGNAALHGCGLIRSLAESCLISSGDDILALQISLVFSKENGLLSFIHKSLSIEHFRECREEALKFILAFVEKIGLKVQPYAQDVKRICVTVYTKGRSAKCGIPALELLIKLLQNLQSSYVMEDMKVGEIFNKFYGELAIKSKVPDTVLERIYELLGILGEVQPSEMIDNSEKLYRAYLGELKIQMTSATRQPKFPIVAGCLKGLTALMYNFTKSMDEDPRTSKEIFDFTVKAISPQIDLKRYAVPLAGLHLFSKHAVQFSTYLLDNYVSLFQTMSKWSGHQNAELKKAGHSALDSFLKQISSMVAKDVEMHKNKLQFFMEQFYAIIRNMDASNKELSIAIRGYGLFAAPCKVIRPKDVDFMYVELLQRCKQMYLTEAETIDDHVYQLPSFLQSIASVIFHLDAIPEIYTPVLERLIIVQIDSFPQYSTKMQTVCCRSIVKVFLALAAKGPVLWSFMSTVLHQGLIRICSKPLVFSMDFLGKNVSKSEESNSSGEVRTGKWKVPTYKDYLVLFRTLLSCDTMKDILLADEVCLTENSPLQSLNRLLYDELIKSIIKIIDKLDLTVQKQNINEEKDGSEGDAHLTIPTSDPAANLQPSKPKDYTAFINLVEFCREILPDKHIKYFEPWIYSFGYELIIQATHSPFISGFYKLLSIAMKIAKKTKYFVGVSPKSKKTCPEDPEKSSCFALFSKFGKEVTAKMKQYKDELLASCLTFVLSLPYDIIMLDIKAYIPALQNAFKLGLSYTPMADVALDALEDWSAHIPRYTIQPYYKDIVPCLDGYLKTSASAGESQNNWEVKKLSKAIQKGMNKVVIQHLKKSKNLELEEDPSLEAVKARVVRLLGTLGGQINRYLITAASAEEKMKKFVSWDIEKRLNFAVPFADMKPVIYLDLFLPRVTELALCASDRQTKVAACELLHSILMFMLGKASQIPEGNENSPPMFHLYKHMFPVLLRLACDVDQVTRQLYGTLVMELIHWFTNNKKFESQDTVTLLEAILDGIVDPVDSALRDFCGQCVHEFLKWSIKQTTPQQQEKSPVNTKSLFKRLYSLALHPNAFKRLGAALAFNNIYREFREENALVDQFVFEALVVYLESLALTHGDEKSLGTVQQCCDAIDHLKRIIKQKASTLNKKSNRRLPRGFPSRSVCLEDVVMWLLRQCGQPQTECRHKVMELFFEFVPLLPGNPSPSSWLGDVLQKEGIYFLIKKFEGGGCEGENVSGILSHSTLYELQGSFSLRAVVQWMDMLLAALDCYNTFIEQGMIKPNEILATNTGSTFLKSLEFFLGKIALYNISGAEQCFSSASKDDTLLSPQEREEYNYSKCTIIVRIMVFGSMILETHQQHFWKLLEKELLNENLIKLVVKTICDPKSVGFNIADVQIMENLPNICVRLVKALMKSPYNEYLENSIKEIITMKSIEELCTVDLYNSEARLDHVRYVSILSACRQLHKAGLLYCILQSKGTDLHFEIGSKLMLVVYKGIAPGDERRSLPSLDISSKQLAEGLLHLAFAFGVRCTELVSLLLNTLMLSVPLSGTAQESLINFSHGEYFYSLFLEIINQELLKNLEIAVLELMKSALDSPKMVSTVLNGMLDQSFKDRATCKQQGVQLVAAILKNWGYLDHWWAKESSPESKMCVLTLLAKVLQIDSSMSFTHHEAFSNVFNTYTCLLTDQKLGLNLKSQAIIILPFFTNLVGERLHSLKNALDQLVAFNFPLSSDEFPKGSLKYNNYVDCIKKFLDALELSQNSTLLALMTEILCRDHKHIMEELFEINFKRISKRGSCERQVLLLDTVHQMFQNETLLSNITRQAYVDRCLLILLLHCSLGALKEFLSKIITEAMDTLKSRFTKSNETAFETQLIKKISYYKILEVMYSRLSKEDVYSKDSRINQAFQHSIHVEGNELTKTLIKSCYDAFTENMSGETQMLEKRRQFHCAAYNCAIAVISCVFNESKFYQGFLFTEKPDKNLLIFENLLDLQRRYSFPIEIEVPLEKKKRYIIIRKEARQAMSGDSAEPQYLASASYMVDSSLSEEMSQFDFSTGIQSFSYNSEDPTISGSHFRKKEITGTVVPDDVMELEMDELNQHECMASMTTLVQHMHRNNITPVVEKDTNSPELPPWMKFLHSKLGNSTVPLNIRLFVAKLIVNTEEVFQPYAKWWLGPLLQLVVSGDNGGEGIHYMMVEIVVTLLSWTNVATPKGNIKDEILANRLLEFLMKNVFHQKRAVFRHNLEIIKTVIECWKDCLNIPYRIIFQQFSGGDPNTKDNSVGIQLLGIVLANNLPPYDPKCEIDNTRYFQALCNNMALIRYKEVYAAAAEVLGLILQYIAEKENIFEGPIYDMVIKQLKLHQNTRDDKFIVCLNKITKSFPHLADRFMNFVFFLIPKLHGVMKTHCLEVVMCRTQETADMYLQLKSKEFTQVMCHRDDERQTICLNIVYKMLPKLKPAEVLELLPTITGFISHPSPLCRGRMYDVLMWIYDNYSDSESQADEESSQVLKLAKEFLLQGLIDENSGLQLIVRNFWSDETRLPTNTLDRMLSLLRDLYCDKIETQYLSLATNFLLEMTSKSPDYSRKMFEYPLSECKFQDFVIDSNWRYRSTILTPIFMGTQASQSAVKYSSQEGYLGGQLRATQQQFEFTPTQNISGRSSFNWLIGNSVDTFADYYTVPSSSESVSSSMLLINKRTDRSYKTAFKPLSPNFGEKRLGLPGDEVDSKTKDTDERTEILRLRRRFLKDQEKLSLIYARKGVAEQKQEKEIKSQLKIKHDAQITLYRKYRQGDLPDIQIEYSSLITPLQVVAQKDPTLAKQLFSSLFSGILEQMKKSKSPAERNNIIQQLLHDFNHFLTTTVLYFPPFISCILEMTYQHKELVDLNYCNVSTSCLASLQQPVGILLLEQALVDLSPVEQQPPSKRMRGKGELSPDVTRWIELARLYRSVGDYDVLRDIFSGKIGMKEITHNALLAEAKSDYAEAAKLYDKALSVQDWPDDEPTEAEKDFWEIASLECYNHLTEWKSLEYCSTMNIDNRQPADLNKIWSDPFFQEAYLPYIIRSKLKLLLHGGHDQSLLTFIDEAMKAEEKKALIEMYYSQELSLLYILQDDFDRARYYVKNAMQVFMQNYSNIDSLLYNSRMIKLQSVQALTETQDFINFMNKPSNLTSRVSLKRFLNIWTSRYPDTKMDPMNIWDDIIANRCFFLDKIQEKFSSTHLDDSMELDGDASFNMEMDNKNEDIYSEIKNCKFAMKMKMIECARKQNSFSVALKLLKDLHGDSKTCEDWRVKWNHSYCCFSHSRSRSQSSPEQILTVLKTVPLLEEIKLSSMSNNPVSFRNQNLLLGTTFLIMANALSKNPNCLDQIEEEKAGKVLMLSEERPDDIEKVVAGLNKRAFLCFSGAVKKAEEELQSMSFDHIDTNGIIDAYMTLANFCDSHLRKEEEQNSADVNIEDLQVFPAIVVEKVIKALKLNSNEARLKFPRLLQIVEKYPERILGLMAQEISSVPCWQFIGWISQLMAMLDKNEAHAVQHMVEEIASSYPQAIVYPFMISSESFSFPETAIGHKNKEFVERMKSKLYEGRVIQDFVHSLEQLSNPAMLFKDWIEDVRNELGKTKKNTSNIQQLYDGMYQNLGNLDAPGLGWFRKQFIKEFGKELDSHFGKGGSKLLDMNASVFSKVALSLFAKMKKCEKQPGNLKECSPWMSEFKPEFLRTELEIPGQYDGKGKPLPEYHAKISGFDERIKVMQSIRKPKRIVIRGNDEREYPFLVKGGEDLRQDQRIEQLFEVMNNVLSRDAACSQRNMQIKTYQVIPVTTRLGLIEWLENTYTLKEFLLKNMSEQEKNCYNSPKGPCADYSDWLCKMGERDGIERYMTMFKRASRTEVVTSFQRRENRVPEDLLRKAFVKMSATPEALLSLRSHFASTHALLCISHWILGIGDRHLSNFMISMETGGLVGIDFGHAFGSATQFLQVPELMPFRLTRQFVNLMLPMKESGLIYSVMVHSLRAYRINQDVLINTMDIFVKEPSLDWKNFELKQLRKGGTWTKEINTDEVNWYPLQKVKFARRKLAGANPAVITCDELRLGHEKSETFREYVSVAQGSKQFNIRARESQDGLTEEIQVKCLIDQATDPNILGRTWEGWEPWM
ncbi:DNA-dependent protein kinase catalytic subunit isoform X1 [Crotalus tigris]|uniref:DNA-dependent protein kinase catalytic subunit isoform X1 n=1 Tax=Crotalus tigris TaxID=88082 RepID=UPI00192F91FC|nr:DNA-dependent protein kinase catalytic subunit isoform X1 [Crotalus tigris]